jgi:hypothetical protein
VYTWKKLKTKKLQRMLIKETNGIDKPAPYSFAQVSLKIIFSYYFFETVYVFP